MVDDKRKRVSGTTCFGGNAGLRAVAYGMEKIFKLKAKRFAFGDVGLGEGEAGGGEGGAPHAAIATTAAAMYTVPPRRFIPSAYRFARSRF